jgi:hypothetical protein
MIDLFWFPLHAGKLELSAMATEDPELVVDQGWEVVAAQEVHILLTRQVGTLIETKSKMVLLRIAPVAATS